MEIKDLVFNCSKQKISEKRRFLLKIINGDMFYSIYLWPRDIKRLFWNKPISDKDTFKLLIFCGKWMPTLVGRGMDTNIYILGQN